MCDITNKEKIEYEIALNCRNKEIELFWTRSNFYWLFNAAALTAYIILNSKQVNFPDKDCNYLNIILIISSFGFLSSTVWMLGNMGSRWWQEHWGAKLDITLQPYEVNIFSPEWWKDSGRYQANQIKNNLPVKKYNFFTRHT